MEQLLRIERFVPSSRVLGDFRASGHRWHPPSWVSAALGPKQTSDLVERLNVGT